MSVAAIEITQIDIDHAIRNYAKVNQTTYGDAMKFLSTRNSLECAAHLLGLPVPVSLESSNERQRALPRLKQLGEYMDYRGYNVPKLWEDTSAQAYIGAPVQRLNGGAVMVLQDVDRQWNLCDITKFDAMWHQGKSVADIAESLERDDDEVLLLVIHEARKGRINVSASSVIGNKRR